MNTYDNSCRGLYSFTAGADPDTGIAYDAHLEHLPLLQQYADGWVANARSTVPMTEEDRTITEAAVRAQYRNAGRPEPKTVVFARGPVTGHVAARIASGIWYLRQHPEVQVKVFGHLLSDRGLKDAILPTCRIAFGEPVNRVLPKRSVAADAAAAVAADAAAYAAAYAADADADAADAADAAVAVAAAADAAAAAAVAADAAAYAAAYAAAADVADAAADADADAADVAVAAAAAADSAVAADAAADAAAAASYAYAAAADVAAAAAAAAAAADAAAADVAVADAADVAAAWPLVLFLLRCCGYYRYWRRWTDGGNLWVWRKVRLGFFREVAQLPIDWTKWIPYEEAARHAGPRFHRANFAIVSDRSTAFCQDDRNRLHCEDGPALAWRDGIKLYYWHGTKVSQCLIEDPESYSREEIMAEPNSEVVRALAERMGWDAFLERVGATVVDRGVDEHTELAYELLALDHKFGDKQPKLLRMQSPVEHDGSQPRYAETIPSEIATWQAARAWKFPRPDGSWPIAAECNADPRLVFAYEDGIAVSGETTHYARQGDVCIQVIEPISLEGRTEVPRAAEGLVLRRGTAAGNAHVIRENGARLYTPGDVKGSTLLIVDAAVALEHAQHFDVPFVPQWYRIMPARTGTDEAWAAVED